MEIQVPYNEPLPGYQKIPAAKRVLAHDGSGVARYAVTLSSLKFIGNVEVGVFCFGMLGYEVAFDDGVYKQIPWTFVSEIPEEEDFDISTVEEADHLSL